MPGEAETVQIAVLPRIESLDPGESADQYVLGDVDVQVSQGTFEAFIDPSAIPVAYVGPEGLVDLLVYASSGDRAWETETTARITRYEDQSIHEAFWTDPVETVAEIVPDTRRSTRDRGVGAVISARTEVEDDGVVTRRS